MIELVRTPQVARGEIPAPIFRHLRRLTDAGGLYEHAEGVTPRREHGYCLDDVARALVVVCREEHAAELDDLREQYLTFVLAAQEPDGRFHNRRQLDLTWSDTASVEDCWGRALWGLGTAVARVPHLHERALAGFDAGVCPALAPPARDGVRRARSGGGPRRAAGPPRGAGADDRGRDRGRPPRRRRGVALARAAAELRQRGAARGPARRGRRTGLALTRRGRPPPAGLAARRAVTRRAPVRGAGRRPRSRRGRPCFRPAADRGGGARRRVRTGLPDRRTAALGRGDRARRGMVLSASTTPAPRCAIR